MKTKETKKSDLDKFHTERNAAQVMRDDLCFLVGWIKSDCPQGASAIAVSYTHLTLPTTPYV